MGPLRICCCRTCGRPTFGAVHDALDEEEEGAEAHLHQQLVAMAQADGQGKVPLHHTLLGALRMDERRGEQSGLQYQQRGNGEGLDPREGKLLGTGFWSRCVSA